jgi:hypothetical protein
VQVQARLEEHELAVTRHEELDHLIVGIARGEPFAHQHAQILREWRVGIVDRLVLADHAAQLL